MVYQLHLEYYKYLGEYLIHNLNYKVIDDFMLKMKLFKILNLHSMLMVLQMNIVIKMVFHLKMFINIY